MKGDPVGMAKRSMVRVLAALALISTSTYACVTQTSLGAQTASATPTTFTAVDDTYVDATTPATNYGTAPQITVDGAPLRHAFLKFTLRGLAEPVANATLRLQVRNNAGSGSSGVGVVRSMRDTSWSETEVVYENAPDIDGAPLGSYGPVVPDTWYEIDVTSAISGNGTYSFGLTSVSTDGARFESSETGPDGPQLVVTTEAAAPNPGPNPGPAPSGTVLVGAGDISTCSNNNDEATAKLLDEIPGTVFTAGDAAYQDGSAANFNNCYDPTWGRHKARTRPSPGNHEYRTQHADGYFDYFGAAAGPAGRGYYSYDLGGWHVVALNSNCSQIGGCQAGSAQERWLRQDLAANTESCTIAYWHHPLFTSGANHPPSTEMRPLYDALYDHGAEVVVTGHNHQYERFAPQNPNGQLDDARGIRAFVVGTGGAGLYAFDAPQPNSQVRNATTHGVLQLTLRAGSYDWQFVPVAGKTFTDSGSGTCH